MIRQLAVGYTLTLRQLLRNRLALLLLFVVPGVFFWLVTLTTSPDRSVRFRLASLPASAVEDPTPATVLPVDLLETESSGAVVIVPQQHQALTFIALGAVAVVIGFLGMSILQRGGEAYRRLVRCGFGPLALILASLGALLCATIAVSVFVALLLRWYFAPARFGGVVAALIACGWVYGSYGLLIGALFRRELIGALFVVVLTNVDVSWLQNPLLYAEASNQALIRAMPAYFPSQAAMASAFTEVGVGRLLLKGLAYGVPFLMAAAGAFAWRTRSRR
jgi:hypothetical protein